MLCDTDFIMTGRCIHHTDPRAQDVGQVRVQCITFGNIILLPNA
jgi:hypothetical protein